MASLDRLLPVALLLVSVGQLRVNPTPPQARHQRHGKDLVLKRSLNDPHFLLGSFRTWALGNLQRDVFVPV